jgi:hypothetical protein
VTLRNGKFYDDAGNVVPLEFGNKEQIEWLNYAERLAKEGEEPTIQFSGWDTEKGGFYGSYFTVKCLCGQYVEFPNIQYKDGLKRRCDCGNQFKMVETSDDSLVVKLIK